MNNPPQNFRIFLAIPQIPLEIIPIIKGHLPFGRFHSAPDSQIIPKNSEYLFVIFEIITKLLYQRYNHSIIPDVIFSSYPQATLKTCFQI